MVVRWWSDSTAVQLLIVGGSAVGHLLFCSCGGVSFVLTHCCCCEVAVVRTVVVIGSDAPVLMASPMPRLFCVLFCLSPDVVLITGKNAVVLAVACPCSHSFLAMIIHLFGCVAVVVVGVPFLV